MPAASITRVVVVAAAVMASVGGMIAVSTGSPHDQGQQSNTPTPTATPTPGLTLANLFVNPAGAGATPTRCPAVCPYVAGDAYGSLDAASDAASCGDLVLVRSGTLAGNQIISSTRTCSGWSTTSCSSCVTIREYPSETVTVTGDLDTNADWTVVDGFTVGGDWDIHTAAINNVLYKNNDVHNVFFDANGTQFITMLGGSVGNVVNSHPQLAPVSGTGSNWMQDVLFQGVDFHDVDCTDCVAFHVECIQVVGGTRITFRGNRFRNCSISDLQLTQYNGSGTPVDFVIENNWFGSPADGGTTSFHVNNAAAEVLNLVFQYNSGTTQPGLDNVALMTNAIIRGNYMPIPSCTLPGSGWSFVNNVWSGGTCSASDASDPTLDFVNTTPTSAMDLHLTSTSSGAVGNGDPTCPAADYDGDSRPLPALTTCDAGSDEVSQ